MKTLTEWIRYFMDTPSPTTYTERDIKRVLPMVGGQERGTTVDYGLWYIHGELQFIEAGEEKRSYYSPSWRRLLFQSDLYPEPIKVEQPINLQTMIAKGDQLVEVAGNPPLVKIEIQNRRIKTCCKTLNDLFFKQFDFTPYNGTNSFVPREFDKFYGDKITG